MSRITIKDIAKAANVSVSTVSLVMSNRGYVSTKTRARVEKVITRYNYYPKRSARQLATGMTGNIGFIISSVHLYGSECFYSRILLGTELEARKRDYYILLTTVDNDYAAELHTPRFLKGNDVDAVIIAGGVPNQLIEQVHRMDIPYVLVDYKHPEIKSNLIRIENFDGAHEAVTHLLDSGFTKPAFVGGSFYHSSIKERFAGYKSALIAKGLDTIAQNNNYHYLVEAETSSQIGFEGIIEMLRHKIEFDAVLCANDTTAMGCLQALRQKNIEIPDGVAVVGFDDISSTQETTPSLTTVHVPKFEMGIQAVRLLFDQIDHPSSGLQTRIINTELVIRESTNGYRL